LDKTLQHVGGPLIEVPWWILTTGTNPSYEITLNHPAVRWLTVEIEPEIAGYIFSPKVSAFAQAERLCSGEDVSLVWLNPECLVIQPPVEYFLSDQADAAFRPVHHRNIGSPVQEPMDPFWEGVYSAVNFKETGFTVRSFADEIDLRPYFNTHAFSLRSSMEVGQAWLETFRKLVLDQEFQESACQDIAHKIFLHQAVLSLVITSQIKPERIRLLPPTYNYPLNLHSQVPEPKRPGSIDDLVTAVYEEEADLQILPGDATLMESIVL